MARHRPRLTAALLALLLGAALWPAAAAADGGLQYEAAPGCPDREAFLAKVAQRSSGQVSGAKVNARLRVQVSAADDGGWRGVLYREDAAGVSEPRVLSAERCADLIEGLALTVALSALPAAEGWPTVSATAPAPPPAASPSTGRHRGLVGVGLRLGSFVADQPMTGLALSVGVTAEAPEKRWWTGLGWDARLHGSLNRSDVGFGATEARFELYAGGLSVCPAHAGAGRRARLSLCANAEAGLLRGRGIQIASPRWASAPWLTAGLGTELRVALTPRWQLLFDAQLARSWRETTFVFAEPRALVARTAPWAGSTSAAAVLLFP